MVSYADFITVLFAFFVVLFASAYRENRSIKKVSNAIHYGFVDMESFSSITRDSHKAYPPVLLDRPDSTHRTDDTRDGKSDETAAMGIDIEALRRQLEAAIGRELKEGTGDHERHSRRVCHQSEGAWVLR